VVSVSELEDMFDAPLVRRSKSGKSTRTFHDDGTTEFTFNDVDQIIENQLVAFREKFGRDPEGHEPLLFDPLAEDPEPLSEHAIIQMVEMALESVEAHPSIKYAWDITGRLVTEENRTLLTPAELTEWYCVIRDWELANPGDSIDEEETPEITAALNESLDEYRSLRERIDGHRAVGFITLDLLSIATYLLAGRVPSATHLMAKLAYQTSDEQVDTFVMVAGSLLKETLNIGILSQTPELLDSMMKLGETYNVDTEVVALINSIESADNLFKISGDNITMIATVVCAVAGLLIHELLPQEFVFALLDI
jgi:hypothetical protein